MDSRFQRYYERELRFIRELGSEFVRQFPKVAGRLGLSDLECADPQVERLLQGFSFTAARAHMRLDAEYDQLTGQLLDRLYPPFLGPTPSMAVLQLEPSTRESTLQDGEVVPRDTRVRARVGVREQAQCEYRTSREVALWPIQIQEVEYTPVLQDLAELRKPMLERAKALLRIRLRTTARVTFDQLALNRLPLFIQGGDELAFRVHEHLVADSLALLMRPVPRRDALVLSSEMEPVRALGFGEDEALLPSVARSFQSCRLLHQYFAFPSAFAFVELGGLAPGVRRCPSDMLDLLIPVQRHDPLLDSALNAERLCLFATPAVNLFPRECARVLLADGMQNIHIIPDSTRPTDLEIHSITSVAAYGAGTEVAREFRPMHSARAASSADHAAHYTLERRPHEASGTPQPADTHTEYAGSEVFLNLFDCDQTSRTRDLRQLGVSALCTNRGLPLLLRAAAPDERDFTLVSGAPVGRVRCLAGPTAPRSTPVDGDLGWRLVSHLSVNYLSLCDSGADGAQALREMLGLYAQLGDPTLTRQIEGVRSIASRPLVRPLPGPGPMRFGHGLEVSLLCQDAAFQGGSAFILASVLAQFFAKYVSTNSFTETVLRTVARDEVYRWPALAGLRHVV